MRKNQINIGLFYEYNENWIGGTYYMENLVNCLQFLPEGEIPNVTIYSDQSEEKLKNTFVLKNINFGKSPGYNLYDKLINKLIRFLVPDFVLKKRIKGINILAFNHSPIYSAKKIYWIPDFQEFYYPQFFKQDEIEGRKKYHKWIVENGTFIIFSSKAAQKDFNTFYPDSKLQQFVLPFAVIHPSVQHITTDELIKKYNISSKYFICCNQFWIHKNHIIVLEALKILIKENPDIKVVFTGKEHDYRNSNSITELKEFVEKNGMQSNVSFLGFISREDQLALIRDAVAVVQPSLFEGWSTVVEDAKALNKYIISSDLDVHQEQINNNVAFFDPHNASDLAKKMKEVWNHPPVIQKWDYQNNRKKFSQDFISVLHTIVNH